MMESISRGLKTLGIVMAAVISCLVLVVALYASYILAIGLTLILLGVVVYKLLQKAETSEESP